VIGVALIFALLAYIDFFSSLANIPRTVLPDTPAVTLIGVLIWVPICALPFLGLYQRYLNESKSIAVSADGRFRKMLALSLLTWVTMSSTYLTDAIGIVEAFEHYWFHWSDGSILLAVFPILGWAFFSHLVCKAWTDKKPLEALRAFGSLFSVSGVWIWIFIYFLDHQTRTRYEFNELYPGALFNLDALNFVWYLIVTTGVLAGYLLTIRFHNWTKVMFNLPTPDPEILESLKGTEAHNRVQDDLKS
jgi:hypothetical protein